MPPLPVHHTETSDGPWDGPANEARIPRDASKAVLRSAFAWQESDGDAETKAHYRFIHHEVSEDGEVGEANLVACSAGIGVLNGGRGGTTIPDEDREGVWKHLSAHLTDAEREAPPLKALTIPFETVYEQLSRQIEKLGAAMAFPMGEGSPLSAEMAWPFIANTFEDRVVVSFNEQYWEAPYTVEDDRATIAPMTDWKPVKREWVARSIQGVRAIRSDGDDVTIGGWGMVFGGADLYGEWFTKSTDLWLDKLPGPRPVLWDHSLDPTMGLRMLSQTSRQEVTDSGVWIEAQLKRSDSYHAMILALVEQGVVGISSGAPPHLIRHEGKAITSWPIVEWSLTATPAEPRTLGVEAVRSLQAMFEALRGLPLEDGGDPSAESERSSEVGDPGISASIVVQTSAVFDNPTTTTDAPRTVEVRDVARQEATMPDIDTLAAQVQSLSDQMTKMTEFSDNIKSLLRHLEDTPALRGAGFVTVDGGKADKGIRTFADFLKSIYRKDEVRLISHYGAVKAMSEGDGAAGGWLVPEEFRPALLQMGSTASPLVSLCTQIPVSVESGHFPALDQYVAPTAGVGNVAWAGKVVATTTAEAGTYTETTPGFTDIAWRVHKIGGYTKVSNELIADSPQSVEALLRSLFGIAIANKREFGILRGTGVGEPLGVLNAPCAVGVTTTSDNVFAYADALGMIARHKIVSGAQNVRWVMHQTVIPDFGLTGWTQGDTVVRLRDLGYGEAILSEHLPMANGDDVVLGDWGAYLLFIRQELAIAFSEHVNFINGQGTWRFDERIDGQPWVKSTVTLADPTGSTTVSPFVYHDD